jgi:hypothetical protein
MVNATPWLIYPRERDLVPIGGYRSLGGLQGRSERARKISPPPGSDSRTVPPVASPFTDYAVSARVIIIAKLIVCFYPNANRTHASTRDCNIILNIFTHRQR